MKCSFMHAWLIVMVWILLHIYLSNSSLGVPFSFDTYLLTFGWQAVMKLSGQLSEQMKGSSHIWAPPIYRRLISTDKRGRDASERCLLKIRSTVIPPSLDLSKVPKPYVIFDKKRWALYSSGMAWLYYGYLSYKDYCFLCAYAYANDMNYNILSRQACNLVATCNPCCLHFYLNYSFVVLQNGKQNKLISCPWHVIPVL